MFYTYIQFNLCFSLSKGTLSILDTLYQLIKIVESLFKPI